MAKKPKQQAIAVPDVVIGEIAVIGAQPIPDDVQRQSVTCAVPPDSIRFRRVPGSSAPLPARATPGSAGLDLVAASPASLAPGARALIGTGFAIEIPAGHVGHIRPRSGLALEHGVVAFGGTIDADYRGEIQVLLFNHGADKVAIERGQRIAQLVITPVAMLDPFEAESLGETERGAGGFGSSGA